ncbi:MAG: STAS domain-containing protein [Oscillochloris sp.]|nr:STAS domain-containing protein [Oscillochloris sp.]
MNIPNHFLAGDDTRRLLDDFPISLMVYGRDGLLQTMNRRAEEFWAVDRAAIVGRFNLLEDPQSVAQGSRKLFQQALEGARFVTDPQLYDTSQVNVDRRSDRQLWIRATVFPLSDAAGAATHVVLMHEDVTAQIEQNGAMEAARTEIANQRAAIDTLASPVVEVWEGILTVPLIGLIDGRRAMAITERLLEAIVEHQADIVILDITGVPMVDTAVASALLQAAQAVSLLGSQVVLVGITGEIAQTLVQLGVDLSRIITLANLKAAINWAFRRQGLVITQAGAND